MTPPGRLATAAIAATCGFGGAFAAVQLNADQLRGQAGARGEAGPPGPTGPTGPAGTSANTHRIQRMIENVHARMSLIEQAAESEPDTQLVNGVPATALLAELDQRVDTLCTDLLLNDTGIYC